MPTTYAIPNGATQFAATLWSGNNSTQSIVNATNTSGTSFQPDLVWLKQRTPTATGYILEDSVRGALQYLGSESTAVESTIAGTVTSFNSNGFNIGSQAGTNATGSTYVGWQWKASNAAAVSNTDGSISSQLSANQTAGFSIVTYTGISIPGTVGHGLGTAPKLIIVKSRTGGLSSWAVWHTSLAANEYLLLESPNGKGTATTTWNNTLPSTTAPFVFSVGSGSVPNTSTWTYVAYCWAEINGYSKFGSYTGNTTNLPFVYLGFRPRWIMIKRSDTTANWRIFDTSRDTSNVEQYELYPNLAIVEGTFASLDGVSNGFKIRNTDASYNATGGTYIYAAFAENPFKYANAR